MSWKETKSNLFSAVDKGNYPLILESYEIKTTKPEKGSKLMYVAHFKVEENDDEGLQKYVGRVITDWMVVGEDNDPGAEEEETMNSGVNKGVAKIKRISEAAEVEPDDPDADVSQDLIEEVLDKAIGVSIIARIDKKGPKGGENNNVNGYFKVGEVQIGLDTVVKKGSKFGKPETKSIHELKTNVKPKAKLLTIVPDDEDDEGALPPPKATAKPATKAKTAKKVDCPMDCGEKIDYADLPKHVQKCKGPADEDGDSQTDNDDD